MKKITRKSNGILLPILFTLCAVVLIIVCILFAKHLSVDSSWEQQADQQSAEEHTVETTQSDTEDQTEEKEEEAESESSEPVMQEIDGRMLAVREELPIVQPTVLPADASDVSITVEKSNRLLKLYSGDTQIAQYSIGLGSVPEGAKQQEGDKRTPEGQYEVCVLNGESKFYLALGLNYPNRDDAARGLSSGLITQEEYDDSIASLNAHETPNWYTKLGGMIMIHGQKGNLGGQADWTTGCVGVDNAVMDILWQYCKVGTPVTILP